MPRSKTKHVTLGAESTDNRQGNPNPMTSAVEREARIPRTLGVEGSAVHCETRTLVQSNEPIKLNLN